MIGNNSYAVAKMVFEQFCKERNWLFISIGKNPKNETQGLARCVDDLGQPRTFLINKNGYYFECLPGKQFVYTPYVLEEKE